MVSASEACAYVANLFPPGELNLSISTIALLYLCALLNFWGIRESAKIALVIFTVSTPAPLPAPPAVPRRACTIHRCTHRPSRHALASGAHRHDRCAHRCFGMVLLRAPRGAVLYDMTCRIPRATHPAPWPARVVRRVRQDGLQGICLRLPFLARQRCALIFVPSFSVFTRCSKRTGMRHQGSIGRGRSSMASL